MTTDTTTTTPATGLAGLAEMQHATSKIIAEMAEVREDAEHAMIEHQMAGDAILSYHKAVATGKRDADPEHEAALVAERDQLRARMRRNEKGAIVGHMPSEARIEALQADLDRARRAEGEYVLGHRVEIIAELVAQAREARAVVDEARQAVERAWRTWERAQHAWTPFVAPYELNPREIPPNPLDATRDQVRIAGIPRGSYRDTAPQWLTPAPWSLIADEIPIPNNPRGMVHVPSRQVSRDVIEAARDAIVRDGV